ncbi:MAG: hypothetical protein LBJ98_01120 [Endomicrobium sp.]|jgi:hypothetical protein|nr:hypothetical protein [Endomicrobium sp.]
MKRFKVTFEEEIRYVSEVVIEAGDAEKARRKFNNLSEKAFGELDWKDVDEKLISSKIKEIEEIEG